MKTVESLKKIAAVLIATLIASSAYAGGKNVDRPATNAEKAVLAKILMSNPVVKAAYTYGRTNADSCEFKITKAIQQGAFEPGTSFRFEASIFCSAAGDEDQGAEIVYFAEIKGTTFGPMIDPLQMTVQHAG